jgi:1,4-dihydroxy-2-naphthoyl-CoA hydrolase
MFPKEINPQQLTSFCDNTLVSHIGIEFTEVLENGLVGKMPVDDRTRQPLGLLHGGASVVLAETLGSVASNVLIDPARQYAVGLEINANHIKSAKDGYVTGTCTAIHVGKKTHVWDIRIVNENDELVCVSRITMAIIDRKR